MPSQDAYPQFEQAERETALLYLALEVHLDEIVRRHLHGLRGRLVMARFPSGNDREHAILDVADAGDLLRPFYGTDVNRRVHRFGHHVGKAPIYGVVRDAHGAVDCEPRIP